LEQVPTDQDIIDWFKTNEVPLVAIQGKHYVIERPDDFVKSHLMYVEKFGTNSKTHSSEFRFGSDRRDLEEDACFEPVYAITQLP
jgi:hypothetical protein